MSVLVHLCLDCTHPGSWHEPANRGYLACPCCRDGRLDADPVPTELPTLTSPGGIPEGLWPPGGLRNAGTMHAERTCDCAACGEAAQRVTRREHPVAAPRMEVSFGR